MDGIIKGGTPASWDASSRQDVGAPPSALEATLESAHEDIAAGEDSALLRPDETDTKSALKYISIMKKVRQSKVARFVDKLAVESEPGLSNAQLMLVNHDLKLVFV